MAQHGGADREPGRYGSFQQTTYFSSLDGLRALSVLAVVWHHTGGADHGPVNILSRGHYGVDFFFAISGFLITTLLLREHRRTGDMSLRRFYARRSLRILPLYYLVLAMYVVLTLATKSGTPEGRAFFHHLPAFLTYTTNWFVDLGVGTSVIFYFSWSLATEEQFYLFWPPLLKSIQRRWHTPTVPVGAALLALITINQIALHAVDGNGLVVRVLRSLQLPILAGALGAVLLDSPTTFRRLAGPLAMRGAAPLAAAVLVVELFVGARGELIQVTMVLVVLACCVSRRTLLTPALAWRPLRFVGKVSYGVYLMHLLAANAVRPILGRQSGLIVFVATLPVVLVMASVSFRWFETPILRRKQRFAVGGSPDERPDGAVVTPR